MKNTIKINFALMFVLLLTVTNSYSQLVHPGGWHSQADLTQIRTKIAAQEEPWITGWNAAKNKGPNARTTTNPSALITSNGAMHTAGFDAWVLTMKWVASGDKSYSNAAIKIIDTWVDKVRDFDVYGPTLILSTGAGAMAQAAEVLEHGFNGEAGWNQRQADDAKVWFKEIVYDPWTNTGDFRSTNWGTSALGGNMSMAIFMDSEREFEYQRDAYLYGYQDTDDGCAAVTDYIFDDSGQAQESGRDQAHVQGGIAHLTEAALCAWNQGLDLVSVANNRLRAGVEYHAKYNLGYNDLPFTTDVYNPCDLFLISRWDDAISEEERGKFSPVYYMSSKLFTQAGLDHPYTKEVLTSPGYSPEVNNFAHPGLGMFVFVSTDEDVVTPNPTPTEPTPTPTNGTLVHITKRNATRYAIDGGLGGTNRQNVTLSAANTADEGQLWVEIDRGNGFYSYEKFGTNYSLDGNGGGATNQSIYLWQTSATNQNQQWQKQAVGDGGFKIIKRNATGFAINGGSSGVEGRGITLWSSASTNQNLQWYVTPIASDIRLEAEDFDSMSGIQTENSTESGDNVGFINNGDWLRFEDVNLLGITNMDARVATRTAGGTIEIRTGSPTGNLIGSINVNNTGGFQNWTTTNTSISNTSGTQDVYLVFTGGNGYLFNVNWIEFNNSSTSAKTVADVVITDDVIIYPNPVVSTTTIQGAANSTVSIYDMNGAEIFTTAISSESETIDLSRLASGVYYGKVESQTDVSVIKIIKQ